MNSSEIIKRYENRLEEIQSELELYQKRCEQYAQAYDSLQCQLKELLRHRFGKKSERFIDPENSQLDLFGEESGFAKHDALENEEGSVKISGYSRQKKKSNGKEIPRRIEIIPVSEEEKQCACGMCKIVIRYETKELLHYEPAVHEILEQRREVVACPKGCEGQIKTAPAPLQVLPKAKGQRPK
jgi:transposase